MVALEIEKHYAKEAKERQVAAGKEYGKGAEHKTKVKAKLPEPIKQEPQARDQASKAVGVSGRNVSKAKKLAKESPALAKQVAAGTIGLEAATRRFRSQLKNLIFLFTTNHQSNGHIATAVDHIDVMTAKMDLVAVIRVQRYSGIV